jgi:transcriptional regulator with XRE-family HTH domain
VNISVGQVRAARGLIGWSQEDLAREAKIGRATLAGFETGKREPYSSTLAAIRAALESAGVIFVEENGEGPGVRLRKDRKTMSERLRTGTFVKFSGAIKPPDENYSGQTGIIIAPGLVAGDPSKDWVRWNDGYECAYPSGTLTRV